MSNNAITQIRNCRGLPNNDYPTFENTDIGSYIRTSILCQITGRFGMSKWEYCGPNTLDANLYETLIRELTGLDLGLETFFETASGIVTRACGGGCPPR